MKASRSKTILRQLFAFLSSVQLAVILLLSLAAVLVVGTFMESAHDTPTAQHYVYQTPWFVALLALLGVNIFCAGLSRWPWKRHHTGFLTVHLGLLILLAGSLITLFWGYEGQLIIPEGESRNRFFLKDASIYFYETGSGRLDEISANFRFNPPSMESPVGAQVLSDVLVKIDGYYDKAQGETRFEEGQGDYNPALQVDLSGSRAQMEEWLLALEPDRQVLSVGPAQMGFLDLPKKEDFSRILRDSKLRGPVLWLEGKWYPLRGKMMSALPSSAGPIFIKNFLPDAVVQQGRVVNRSEALDNPAALIEFQGQDHLVFSKFSQLPSVLLGAPSHAGSSPASRLTPDKIRLFYIPEALGQSKNELALAKTDGGEVFYALKNHQGWGRVQALKLGQSYSTGWMDFNFQVKRALNRAESKRLYREIKLPPGQEGPPPAVRINLAREGQIKQIWLGRGESQDITLKGKPLKIAYALKSKPLGFDVELKDFVMGTYQGTNDPSSYESHVVVKGQGPPSETTRIAMNQPLKQGPYKIFQASYQLNPDGPDWTVLAVAYDPGIPVKYTGSIILILGIVIIFYFRKAYFPKRAADPLPKPKRTREEESMVGPILGGSTAKGLMALLMGMSLWWAPIASSQGAETFQAKPKPGFDFSAWGEIPILEGGRKKPIDTFARETVRDITGREKFMGFEAVELLLAWTTQTPDWERVPLIKVHYRPMAEHVDLKLENSRVAPKSLRENSEFQLFLQGVASRSQEGARLNQMEQEGARLGKRLQDFYRIAEGSSLVIYPSAKGQWESLAQLASRYPEGSWKDAAPTTEAKVAAGVQGMLSAYYQGDGALFGKITPILQGLLQKQGESLQEYPSARILEREIFFNRLDPFQWAWIGYAAAAFLLALSWASQNRFLYGGGLVLMVLAFGVHIWGFVLRIMISGRAPVTNMYETVIWIPFSAVVFALILEAIYRKRIFALAGSAMAALGLLVAQSAPHVLDPAIDPLVPVLRNNFWLTVHVLTITLSYGAFTLALGVANVNGGFYLFGPDKKQSIKQLNLFVYRAIQIGVVLLAAGTILGGVWANESWGRFWGWDPKEVWALIALLGYLALLHGRFVGWVKGVGLTIGAILAYLLILMAWYGVNFILGVGLHSYGFSSGGAKFVSIFSAVELIWVLLILIKTKGNWGKKSPRTQENWASS